MTFFVLVAALLGGVALSLLLDEDWAPLHARLAMAAALGLTLVALVGYPVAALFGMGQKSLGLAALLTLLPACLLRPARWRDLAPHRPRLLDVGYAVAVSALLLLVFDHAVFETDSGIFTGNDHNIGDLPFHLAIVQGFVRGDNFPPRHPELAPARLTYPFLADFGVAQLVVAGLDLTPAMKFQNGLLILALFALLYRFAARATGDRTAARIAPLLVFMSGGMGFLLLLGRTPLPQPFQLPFNVTIQNEGPLRFGNVLACLLTTQRGLFMGAPLAVMALDLFWRATERRAEAGRLLRRAAVVVGMLPLVHVHAAAVLLAAALALAFLHPPRRPWLGFAALALPLAIPQLLWLGHGSDLQPRSFFALEPGWESHGSNPILFWLWNAGLFVPTLVVMSATSAAPAALRRFHLPFWGLFLVPNLLRLSPWMWDNMKFFFFWQLASAPLVALAAARLLRARWPLRLAAGPFLVVLLLSGGLDLWRIVSGQTLRLLFDPEAIAFAKQVARATPAHSIVLRAPTANSTALLSGRASTLGYPGHIWSQGYSLGDLENEVAQVYAGHAGSREWMGRQRVDFILVGPQERSRYPLDARFLGQFPIVVQSGAYELRRLR